MMTTTYTFYFIKCSNQVVGTFRYKKNALNFVDKLNKLVDNKLELKLEVVNLINNGHIIATDFYEER